MNAADRKAISLERAQEIIEGLYANGSAMAETIDMLRAEVKRLRQDADKRATLPAALSTSGVAPAVPDTGRSFQEDGATAPNASSETASSQGENQ